MGKVSLNLSPVVGGVHLALDQKYEPVDLHLHVGSVGGAELHLRRDAELAIGHWREAVAVTEHDAARGEERGQQVRVVGEDPGEALGEEVLTARPLIGDAMVDEAGEQVGVERGQVGTSRRERTPRAVSTYSKA